MSGDTLDAMRYALAALSDAVETPYIGDYRNANGCHADRDGECHWARCPQLADNEPTRSGRHCPRDVELDAHRVA